VPGVRLAEIRFEELVGLTPPLSYSLPRGCDGLLSCDVPTDCTHVSRARLSVSPNSLRATRTRAGDQTMPVRICPLGQQLLPPRAMRGQLRGIDTLAQVPGQRSDGTRRIEVAIRRHDDAPAKPIARI
jgi:hypothetical protein